MDNLIADIKACQICKGVLPHQPNPVFSVHPENKVLIIGQAPGRKVHESNIPWNDASGKELRRWMGLSTEQFYNQQKIGIVPMGFCYPGKGKSGDLPPRPECAKQWHQLLLKSLVKVECILLIGTYAQRYYLPNNKQKNLTDTVYHFEEYLPKFLVLPHPSPRNRFWMKKNPWFEESIVPYVQKTIATYF